jgi:hypothetical protein
MNTFTSSIIKTKVYLGLEPSVRLHDLSEHTLTSNSQIYSVILNWYQMINSGKKIPKESINLLFK